MATIGFRLAHRLVGGEAPPPGLAPRLRGAQEIRKVDRPHLRPDAAGTAKIRDAGLRADPGASEDHDPLRLVDHPPQFGNSGIHVSASHAIPDMVAPSRRTPQ
jgi:hypothetical protein